MKDLFYETITGKRFYISNGNKGRNDLILFLENHQVTYEEMFLMSCFFVTNENSNYPNGKGGILFIEAMIKAMLSIEKWSGLDKEYINKIVEKLSIEYGVKGYEDASGFNSKSHSGDFVCPARDMCGYVKKLQVDLEKRRKKDCGFGFYNQKEE